MSDEAPDRRKRELSDRELARATAIEENILAKQPADRRGCPFCGHLNMQTIVRPSIDGISQQPILPTGPVVGAGFPVTLLQCFNCNFVMTFIEDKNILPDGE